MRRIAVWVVVAMAVMAAGTGCAQSGSPDQASLTVSGSARIEPVSGSAVSVQRSRGVASGETVKVTGGAARVELAGDRRIELREGAVLTMGRVPTLVTGDALLVAGDDPLVVNAAGSSVSLVDGTARLARRLGLEAATYSGELTMTSIGRTVSVPALRQATIPSLGVLPSRVEPLRLQSTNAWDRRLLGDAIELSEQLQARSDGLTGQLPTGEGRTAAFLTGVLPALGGDAAFEPALVNGDRPPGETLVGASIAMAGRGGSLAQRWRDAFAFRDDGASWGLVALAQRVADGARLASTLDEAMERAASFSLQAVIESPPITVPAIPVPSLPGLPTVPPDLPKPSTTGSTSSSTTAPPGEEPPPDPLGQVVEAVDGLVGGLLTTLNGAL